MIVWTDLFNIWMIAFVLAGTFLVYRRPLQKYGFPRQLELSLATVCFLIYFFHFFAVTVSPLIEAQNTMGQPCSLSMPERQCYTLSQAHCSKAWEHFAKDCDAEVRLTKDPNNLSALVGPSVKRCIYKKLDRSFRSTRKITSEDNPYCQDYFSKMDAPSNN